MSMRRAAFYALLCLANFLVLCSLPSAASPTAWVLTIVAVFLGDELVCVMFDLWEERRG